ncbi:MAG: hypothetical protein WC001_13115 [Desulfurivibrionaceae bacterium]
MFRLFTFLPPRAGATAIAVLLVTGSQEIAMARMFYMERPRLGAEFDYSFKGSEQVTPTRQSQGTSHLYSEGLSLASRGFVYHPALLTFDFSLEPKWEQQREKYDSGEDSAGGSFFLDYGFDGTLFQERLVSLELMARQSTSTISSSLSPTTTSENSQHGSTMVYNSKKFPTRFSYMSSARKQEGFYPSTLASDSLRLTSSNRGERSYTNLNADYDKRQLDSLGLSQATENASFRLNNSLDFAADRQMRMSSSLAARWTESQSLPATSLELNEFLDWQHTKADQRLQINSNYAARYTANRRDGKLSEDIPLNAGIFLSHRLYENLVSSLSGTGGYNKFEGGQEEKYGGQLNFDYNRRIPKGQISLNMGHGYQIYDRTVTTDFIEVMSEDLAFVDPLFPSLGSLPLANRNIDPETVVVFPADPSEPEYVLGFDYTLVGEGAFVRVVPVFGFRLEEDIKNGKKALVRYRFRSDPSAKLGSLSRTYGAGLSLWSVFNLRYQLSLVQDEFLGGIPPESLADDIMQSVTAQLNYGWSDTAFIAEDEKRAAGSSRRAWKISQDFRWRLSPALSLTAGGGYGESELLDTGSSGQAYNLHFAGQWQPRSNQQWRLEAFENLSTTDRPDRIESIGLGIFYLLRYGLWNVEAGYRHLLDRQPLDGQERTLNTFNLKLRRAMF